MSTHSMGDLISRIYYSIGEEKKLTPKILTRLYFIFPNTIYNSLMIIDKNLVTKIISSTSKNELYVVKGQSADIDYTIIDKSFCSCPSFRINLTKNVEHYYCKHIITVNIVDSLGSKYKIKTVTDKEFSDLLKF